MTRAHIPRDPADPFLTTRQAAQLLGVTLRSVQLWVEAGKLHAGHTPGGHRRIRTSAVLALAAEQGLGEPVVNPLQDRLDAALADGKRLHEAYLGAERELQAARAEIKRITEAGRSVAQLSREQVAAAFGWSPGSGPLGSEMRVACAAQRACADAWGVNIVEAAA